MIYLVSVQIKQIVPFWISGLIIGAIITVYYQQLMSYITFEEWSKRNILIGNILAAFIGAVSPITIYGTLPILAVFSRLKVSQSIISSFIVTSILINPNVFIFSFSLGANIALLRLFLSLLAGVTAGLLVETLTKGNSIYEFSGFVDEQSEGKTEMRNITAVAANFKKAITRTAPNLILGIVLAALFELYFPMDLFKYIFGSSNGLGVLFAASMGVATYYCGGGTIPLIMVWMNEGMSLGSVMAFMMTGPATKLTNLTAVKTIMTSKNFSLYLLFNVVFGIAAGVLIDMISSFVK